jgi:hypothetical protein
MAFYILHDDINFMANHFFYKHDFVFARIYNSQILVRCLMCDIHFYNTCGKTCTSELIQLPSII